MQVESYDLDYARSNLNLLQYYNIKAGALYGVTKLFFTSDLFVASEEDMELVLETVRMPAGNLHTPQHLKTFVMFTGNVLTADTVHQAKRYYNSTMQASRRRERFTLHDSVDLGLMVSFLYGEQELCALEIHLPHLLKWESHA